MEKKYNKALYYCHNFRGIAVMGEAFETLAKFKEFAKEQGMQIAHCPLNHASTMVTNLKVLTPDQYKDLYQMS